MSIKMTRNMWLGEFLRLREGQARQAEIEAKLLADNPNSVICPTCHGNPSSMGGRGPGIRMQALCFTCENGTIDFDTWMQLREERRHTEPQEG